jgi:hypothetical protein
MQEKHLFEYAVLRVVPRVEREEFLNVGVVLYCKTLKFLGSVFVLDRNRLQIFSPLADFEEIETYLGAFEKICSGFPEGGPIARLDPASRFRWLTANRSTVLQISKVHPGLCVDAAETLQKLYTQLVL